MDLKLLKEILASELDCGATIVTSSKDGAHVTNTWNSFINLVDDDTIYIPTGGYKKTQANLAENSSITLSVTNRAVTGKSGGAGTGVIIKGSGRVTDDTDVMAAMTEKFSWIRGALEIKISSITQTM